MLNPAARILTAYLQRQALGGCLMALAVLMAVVMALFMAELLGDLAEGKVLHSTLLQLFLLRLPEAVLLTAPLALVVGLLMSLGELAQGEEMSALRAAGMTAARLLAVVASVAVLWAVLLLMVAGWLSPWAQARSDALADSMAEELLYASVRPGQFQSLGGGRLTVYARAVDSDAGRLDEVFLQFRNDERIEAVTAASGRLIRMPDSGRRVLSLHDGVHVGYQADGSGLPMRRIEFARNDIELPIGAQSVAGDPLGRIPLHRLLGGRDDQAGIELQRRLAPALISLALALFALPVTLSSRRGGRFGIALLALLAYLAYGNGVQLLLARMEAAASAGAGSWLLHAVALMAALAIAAYWWRRW